MKWIVSPNVVWSDAGTEIRLYDTVAGEFQTLNPTAAAIWRHLVDKGDQVAIVAALTEEFGAQDDKQRDLIAGDADRFIRTLAEAGLLVEQPVAESVPAQRRDGD
ncbi:MULTISPECIES: PqqD family protein [unclassified Nonomuraea]|uniref:PqqD family protein n=1 Tax=unclassified Nonomuraea TaxID=2593643 RepID=UPI0033DFB350